jgi:hypothetical protein
MKYLFPLIAVVMLLLTLSLPIMAEEPAKYSFASIQSSKEITIIPGGEGSGNIYFYNIDGNRITHVSLEVSQAPANWQVDIQPPFGVTQVEVNGQIVTVNENLYVEPSQVLSEKVKDPPTGAVCIVVPDRGFALAKEAKITVSVPASEKIGTSSNITISATAAWLGQSGAAIITQSRDFNFSVEVVAETAGFSEKVLGKTDFGKWVPAIIGAAVVVLATTVTLLCIRRRRG